MVLTLLSKAMVFNFIVCLFELDLSFNSNPTLSPKYIKCGTVGLPWCLTTEKAGKKEL